MNKKNFPDLMLEQYLLNELKEDDHKLIEIHLLCDKHLQARIEKIRKSDKLFSLEYSGSWFKCKVNEKLKAHPYKHTHFKPALIPSFCTLVIIPLVLVIYFSVLSPVQTGRIKGGIHTLVAYRKTQLGYEQLQNGSVIRQADLIQLEYCVSDSLLYGMIISIDGKGNTSIHFGTENGESLLLSPMQKKLDFSYELDDSPDFEKFYLITSKKMFLLNNCIYICKKMDKSTFSNAKFVIKMLTFNKVIVTEGL